MRPNIQFNRCSDVSEHPAATLALLLMLPLSLLAFGTLRPQVALLVSLLGGILFLPQRVYFDAPLIPPLGKNEVTTICILLSSITLNRGILRRFGFGRSIDIFWWLLLIGGIGTVVANPDSVAYGPQTIAGLTAHDMVAVPVTVILQWVLPFILGRAYFRSQSDGKILLRGLLLGGLVYLPFVLIEMRFSPQLHRWIYGFSPYDFGQMMREGGYRPVCFMEHGLALALFYFVATTAGWTLLRAFPKQRPAWIMPAAIGLLVFFPLIRSFGALLFVAISVLLIGITKPRTQVRVGLALTLVLCIYPMLKAKGWVPDEFFLNKVAQHNQLRAESLQYRFVNERLYLEKALERPFFGWGGYGRWRAYGAGASDGAWVITLGESGFWGYYGRFAMVLASCCLALRRLKGLDIAQQRILGGLSLIVGCCAFDLIPNGLWNMLTVFYCGALVGLAQGMNPNRRSLGDNLRSRLRIVLGQRVAATQRAVQR